MKPESLPDRPLRPADVQTLREHDYRLVRPVGWYFARGAAPVAYEIVVVGPDWMAGYLYDAEWRQAFRDELDDATASTELLFHLAVEELGIGHVPGDDLGDRGRRARR